MKILYVTDDGEKFNSKDEAKQHENELFEEKKRLKLLAQEKNKRKDEIKDLVDSLVEKVNKWHEDYNEPLKVNNVSFYCDSNFFEDWF